MNRKKSCGNVSDKIISELRLWSISPISKRNQRINPKSPEFIGRFFIGGNSEREKNSQDSNFKGSISDNYLHELPSDYQI